MDSLGEKTARWKRDRPLIAPGGQRRYGFTPRPAGFRWYHTHAFAGNDLKRGGYTGQFGCFYIEPKQAPGAYDQEVFLTLHDWSAYMAVVGMRRWMCFMTMRRLMTACSGVAILLK